MEASEDIYLRELCMLTGKAHKDKSYLYYLLIKEGSYFKESEPISDVGKSESAVDTFSDWFSKIGESDGEYISEKY